MSKYYSLVVSVTDKFGNRKNAFEVVGSEDKNFIFEERLRMISEVESGKYAHKCGANELLRVDIEVHDDDTWELLYII